MFPGILDAIRGLYDLNFRIGDIHVDADALLVAILGPRRLRHVQPILIVVQKGISILQFDGDGPFEDKLPRIVRCQTLQAGPIRALLQGCPVLQAERVLGESYVGDPGEEKGGPPGVVVLVDEHLRGDGQVARMVEDVGVLPHHGRGMDADVVLAEEDLVVLVGDVLLGLDLRPEDVGGSPTEDVGQRHFCTGNRGGI